MKEQSLPRSILLIAIALTNVRIGSSAEQNRVHAVMDLGHQFTFYADGRFHRQDLSGQPEVTSWGSPSSTSTSPMLTCSSSTRMRSAARSTLRKILR